MAKTLNVTHKQRADTTSNWSATNPILEIGELGIVTDTSPMRIKIGNGSTAWNNLAFVTGSYLTEVTTATSLANLPINKENVVVTISAAQGTFSYISTPDDGFQQSILLKNSSVSPITQAIPNTGGWVAVDGASLTVPANGSVEINVWYIDSTYRVMFKTNT